MIELQKYKTNSQSICNVKTSIESDVTKYDQNVFNSQSCPI